MMLCTSGPAREEADRRFDRETVSMTESGSLDEIVEIRIPAFQTVAGVVVSVYAKLFVRDLIGIDSQSWLDG
jgi:hypothetical protein